MGCSDVCGDWSDAEVSGQVFDVSGQVVEVSGQIFEVSGQVFEVSGQVVEVSGQVFDVSGQVSEVPGQVFGVPGRAFEAAVAVGAVSRLVAGGRNAASAGIRGDVLATDHTHLRLLTPRINSPIPCSSFPPPH